MTARLGSKVWTELEKGEAASSICPMPADQLTLPPRQGIDTFIPFMLQQRVSAGRIRLPGTNGLGHTEDWHKWRVSWSRKSRLVFGASDRALWRLGWLRDSDQCPGPAAGQCPRQGLFEPGSSASLSLEFIIPPSNFKLKLRHGGPKKWTRSCIPHL